MTSLWYDKEATVWEEALPLGNGRIGAMVFSGVESEKISLNEDTLWSGYPKDHNLRDDGGKRFRHAQKLVLEGKYKEAQEYIEAKMLGKHTERYLPMGDLILKFPDNGEVESYRRELDLETAVHTLTYVQNGIEFERETFISAPRQAMLMRLSANKTKSINFTATFESQLNSGVGVAPDTLALFGGTEEGNYESPRYKGVKFIAHAEFFHDGEFELLDGSVKLTNATEVTIVLACRTSFEGPFVQPQKSLIELQFHAIRDILNASGNWFFIWKAEHSIEHQRLYNRVELNFGTSLSHLPTPGRLAGWDKPENDPGLYALLFQYGRYLMITGSRPGTQPLNLQGIWNPHFYPPWNSDYTTNINLEMNYWPAEVANLAECHQPLLDFIQNLRVAGAKTAKQHYNAGGYTLHHNSDIWAMTTPAETSVGGARWSFWPVGAGWLSAHVMQHYEYSLDAQFLADAFPAIHDAARFFLDVLVEDSDGTLIFAPSTSPENDFMHEGGAYSVAKTATMTTAIIKETLQNTIKACEILGVEPEIKKEAAVALEKLPSYKIGAKGQFLEWSEDFAEHEPTHRHTSHLYPLFPGNEIAPDTELARACAKTLELRGPESTGWALAWRICLYARLRDRENAFAFLQKQVRPCEGWRGGCYPNMFGSHPPFQIDSNFGAAAGIAELLLQSWQGKVELLPALPKELGTGYVKGLRAKGGITVDMAFDNGKLTEASFLLDAHLPPCELTVVYEGETTLELQPNVRAVFC